MCATAPAASDPTADGEAWLDSVLQAQDAGVSGTTGGSGVAPISETISVADTDLGAEMERWLALASMPVDCDLELGLDQQWTLPTGMTGLDELIPGVGVF